ncbi:unnamed protein product [Phyllotreta striolata]|uniref:Odorant receptor n=1 Tax=Phyllotreta striolata TaxID=444603 RepID=A0A9N9XK13_PHYSR|nr:unnamed protein product [Phyllotreta striolata]
MRFEMIELINKRPYYVCTKAMVYTCLLPKKNCPMSIFYLYSTVYRLILTIPYALIILNTFLKIKNYQKATGVNFSEELAMCCSYGGMYLTIIIFQVKHKDWLRFIDKVVDHSEFGIPPTFDEAQRNSNIVTAMMFLYAAIGVTFYALVPLFGIEECRRMNQEKHLKESCSGLPVWLPFETTNNKQLFILTFYELASSMSICVPASSVAFMAYNSSKILISKIDQFKALLLEALKEKDGRVLRDKLRYCVKYHNHILSLGDELKRLVRVTVGSYGIMAALSIGGIGNQIIQEQSARSIVHFFGFAVAAFTICHAGQIIATESVSIKEVIYATDWYLCDAKTMKDIRFMLARSQIPITLEMLPLGWLNYEFFTMIMKTSYSYITLLSKAT